MNHRIFLDSNVLAYTADNGNPEKKERALRVLTEVTLNDYPVISTQVLQEFYNVATRKLNIDKLAAKALVHTFSKLETMVITSALIEQGIDISIQAQLAFWDGLIIAAAEAGHCSSILSEDMNDGQLIRGIRIVNPFTTSAQ